VTWLLQVLINTEAAVIDVTFHPMEMGHGPRAGSGTVSRDILKELHFRMYEHVVWAELEDGIDFAWTGPNPWDVV
jgi:hypothetical protein